MSSTENAKSAYWEKYYSCGRGEEIPPPSQFAAFMAQEADKAAFLIDVGCGSGRDSLFFAQRGFQVLGVDASHAAVDRCNALVARLGFANARFASASVDSEEFGRIMAKAVAANDGKTVIYARFFLHAITDEEQECLLQSVSAALRTGDLFAVEYRTTRDAELSKETSTHYRRFIDPAHLVVTIARKGFAVEYAAEGFGFAKYRKDDAHVARAIFRKE